MRKTLTNHILAWSLDAIFVATSKAPFLYWLLQPYCRRRDGQTEKRYDFGARNSSWGVHALRMCLIASLKNILIDDNPVAFTSPTPNACLTHIVNILGDDD